MSQDGSLLDALIVAYYQLLRAIRTRSALTILVLYALMATGGALGFVNILHQLEKQVAKILHVPVTETPGAMMEALKEDPDFRSMLVMLLGDQRELLDWALGMPVLTLTHFWICLGLLPALAATVGAEAVSGDAQSRALRFELVRTGRLELVLGRLLGHAVLLALGLLVADVCVWLVAMLAMVGNPPLAQATTLLALTPRLWVWCLPFLGLGTAVSLLTSNLNLARVGALAVSQTTWVLFAFAWSDNDYLPDVMKDLLLPALPQGWVLGLWGPGPGWLVPAVALLGLALVYTLSTTPVFGRKKL